MDIDSLIPWLSAEALQLGTLSVSGLALTASGLALLFGFLWIRSAAHAGAVRRMARETGSDGRLEALIDAQAEMTGRLGAMADLLGNRQGDLARDLADRFDGFGEAVSRSIARSNADTNGSLARLGERLAVIDRAQAQISDLAGDIVQLQDILRDKQSRGAFGEGRMRAIIADALPPQAFAFQATLSNGKRPDCLVRLPNGAPSLAIDAKFPLEAFLALQEAQSAEAVRQAEARLRRDMDVHIRAISEKYLLPGETLDIAFMFVPSESVFAALGERFADVVQRAYRARVVILSPSLLALAIQIVQNLMKDARMREEAHLIQREVQALGEDLARLGERVGALQGHFAKTARDVDDIAISTDKLLRRAGRIERLPVAMPARNVAERSRAPVNTVS